MTHEGPTNRKIPGVDCEVIWLNQNNDFSVFFLNINIETLWDIFIVPTLKLLDLQISFVFYAFCYLKVP